MSWYEFHWSWCAGVPIGETWTGIHQLIKFRLLELIIMKGLSPNSILGPIAQREAILVTQCLGNMKASFLEWNIG